MRRAIFIFGLMAMALSAAVVLDRVAVIVGKHAIKVSDVERDTRVTAFLNKTAVDLSAAARCKSAERLVDQSLIRDEIATGDYERATDKDAEYMLEQIRRERFGDSDSRLRQELTRDGVTEDELMDALRWQLTVLRFIEARFRPAVMVTDDAVKSYYDQHLSELRRQYPKDNSLEALESTIREQIASVQVDKLFDAWLADKRTEGRVVFRQEAFR